MGGYHPNEKPLQRKPSLAINSDKGHKWPEGVTTSRRKTEENEQGGRNPTQPGQRRGTQVEGVAPTLEKGGSRTDQHKLKPTASAGGRETARRLKANPTKVGKATSRLWTEQEHRPYQRQVTKHADYAHHQPRRPEAQQLPYGLPTSTRQRTRVTTTAAELWR